MVVQYVVIGAVGVAPRNGGALTLLVYGINIKLANIGKCARVNMPESAGFGVINCRFNANARFFFADI